MNAKTVFALICSAAMLALGATAKDSGGGKTGERDFYCMDAAELAKFAESGGVAAQHAHAYRLLMKGGKKPDMAEVVRWLSKSAEGGYVPAQFNLGGILLNGCGVATKEAAGVEWIRKAADAKPDPGYWESQKSTAEARYELGVCYRDGRGVMFAGLRTWMLVDRDGNLVKGGPLRRKGIGSIDSTIGHGRFAVSLFDSGEPAVLSTDNWLLLKGCEPMPSPDGYLLIGYQYEPW